MRIVFLTREYPPDTLWGGEAIACHDMAQFLNRNGNDVHVICQGVNRQSINIDNGIYIHRSGKNSNKHSIMAKFDYSFHALRTLIKLLNVNNVCVVEGFYCGTETFLYAFFKSLRIFKKPLILYVHGSLRHAVIGTGSYKGSLGLLFTKMLLRLGDFTARNSDLVIAIAPIIRDELVIESKVNPNKVKLILNPRDESKFKFINSNIKERLGLPKNCKLVLTVGRLEKKKGIHVLFSAIPLILSYHADAKFVFVGKDTPTASNGESFKNYLIEQASDEGFAEALHFIDNLVDDELVQLYSASNVIVSASLYETSTSVPIEAMLCGKPVVVSETGISKLLLLDGSNGIVVPVGDSKKLAEGIIKILSLTEKEVSVIHNMNRKIMLEKFSFQEWVDKISTFHRKFEEPKCAI